MAHDANENEFRKMQRYSEITVMFYTSQKLMALKELSELSKEISDTYQGRINYGILLTYLT